MSSGAPARRARTFGAALTVLLTACPSPPPVTPPPAEQPQSGGVLRVAVRGVGSLDPVRATSTGPLAIATQIFEPLTRLDPATGKLLPGAARRWSVSKDGRTWRFVLGDSRFHDGSRVRARDFEAAFDRLTRFATKSDIAYQLEPVRGFTAAKVDGLATTLAGVSARRKDLLVIALDQPFAELPMMLTHPALGPLHPKYVRSAKTLATKPIGNGPFRVRTASPSRVVLTRNTRYDPAPYLDGIEFFVFDTVDAGWNAFRGHNVDVAEVPPSAVGTVDLDPATGFTPLWASFYFGPNLKLAKYKDPAVRRAISLAIDREAIARDLYADTRDPATGILPRGIRGYVPEACGACVADRDRARQLLRSVYRKKKPPPIRIDFFRERSTSAVAESVAADLRTIGFRVSLRGYNERRYNNLLDDGRHDFAQLAWLAQVPTPDGFLAQQLKTGSRNNTTGYRDRTFDALLAKARRQPDEDRRLRLYHDAEERALQRLPLIPIIFFRNRQAIVPAVRGFALSGAGVFDGRAVWLTT